MSGDKQPIDKVSSLNPEVPGGDCSDHLTLVPFRDPIVLARLAQAGLGAMLEQVVRQPENSPQA